MKEIRLLKLELLNFKGIKRLVIESPNGENLSVYGNNGSGKTTIADAFFWLLFGKDSTGRSDFEIKTLSADGTPINFLDHSVRAEMSIDGKQISLQKTLREKWVKKRGNLDREFEGHETEFIINDIPKSKSEYTAYIKGIADEDIFKLLTNPLYFNITLDKKKRREMLFTMFGNVSDSDVLAANRAVLGDLEAETGRNTIDELKTATAANKRRVDKDLQAIPSRIDEINRFIVDTTNKSIDELRSELKETDEAINLKNRELSNLSIDGEIENRKLEINKQISELYCSNKQTIATLTQEYTECVDVERSIEKEIDRIKSEINSNLTSQSFYKTEIKQGEQRLDALRKEWDSVFNSNYAGNDECPTCGQKLQDWKIAEAVNRFNEEKAAKLKSITAAGEKDKEFVERCNSKLKTLEAEEKSLIKDREAAIIKFGAAVIKSQVKKQEKANFIAKSEKEIEDIRKGFEEWKNARLAGETEETGRKALEDEIAALRARRGEISRNITDIEQNEMFQGRINELTNEARKLSAEYERLERLDYLLTEFTKRKAFMLEEKINSKFKYARFKLFEQQINGGVVETCEVTYNGVPYSVLNNAMRINIGLDIINAFSEHYDMSAVIFLDNAESVTSIFDTKSQQIRLYVSETDNQLRIEK